MINLTIQSLNEKQIQLIDLSNQSILSTFYNNQSINSTYTNLLINIHSYSTKFSFNNMFSNVSTFSQNIIFIFLILLCILTIIFLIDWFKKVNS